MLNPCGEIALDVIYSPPIQRNARSMFETRNIDWLESNNVNVTGGLIIPGALLNQHRYIYFSVDELNPNCESRTGIIISVENAVNVSNRVNIVWSHWALSRETQEMKDLRFSARKRLLHHIFTEDRHL